MYFTKIVGDKCDDEVIDERDDEVVDERDNEVVVERDDEDVEERDDEVIRIAKTMTKLRRAGSKNVLSNRITATTRRRWSHGLQH